MSRAGPPQQSIYHAVLYRLDRCLRERQQIRSAALEDCTTTLPSWHSSYKLSPPPDALTPNLCWHGVYCLLNLQDAPAAWIPSLFELMGGLLVLFLKLFFEHTATGRKMCAERHAKEQEGEEMSEKTDNEKQADHVPPITPRTHTRNTLSAFGSGRFSSIYNVTFSTGSTPRGSHPSHSVGGRSRASLDVSTTPSRRPSVNLRINTALCADTGSISLKLADSASSMEGQQQCEPAGQLMQSQGSLQSPTKCVLRLPTVRLRGVGGQACPPSPLAAATGHVSWQGSFRDHGSHLGAPPHLALGVPAEESGLHTQTGPSGAVAHTPETPRQGRLMWSSSMSEPGAKSARQ